MLAESTGTQQRVTTTLGTELRAGNDNIRTKTRLPREL